jgi:hypothetical protein
VVPLTTLEGLAFSALFKALVYLVTSSAVGSLPITDLNALLIKDAACVGSDMVL